MSHIKLSDILAEAEGEATPSAQAKALGLVYGGFAQWIDPETRITKARTVDGKLVKVDDEEESEDKSELGRLAILNFDPALLQGKSKQVPEDALKMYNKLLTKILQFGGDFIIFTARSQELEVAKYLKEIGITAGVKIAPFASSESQKKRKYVEKKIKAGYSHIQYFDFDKKDIAAIESLKAPYNKLNVRIEAFQLPRLLGDADAPTP